MNAFHEKLKDYLRQYYYVGGMPEVVKMYMEKQIARASAHYSE